MDAKKKQLLIMILLLAAAAGVLIVGWILLPQTLIVQISTGGQPSNTLPKLLGLGVPCLLSALFAVLYGKSGESKPLIVSVVCLLLNALTFAFNL